MNKEEILQNRLEALESGQPLEQVLAGLPQEAADLAPAIRLAAASRQVKHPALSFQAARAQQSRLAAATRPINRRSSSVSWTKGIQRPYAIGGAFVIIIFLAVTALAIGLFSGPQSSAQAASLAEPYGMVEVASAAESSDWSFVTASQQIRQGERVRTYADSGATLVFADGSRTVLGPNADVTLSKLGGGQGDSLQVLLTQNAGTSSNTVIPLKGNGSFFQVETPSGLANVHGTSFDVSVNLTGAATFSVVHGKVAVQGAQAQVTLLSGQVTTLQPGDNPAQPAYQFSLQGTISALAGNLWTVAGVQFSTTPQTQIDGTFKVGDAVKVQGRVVAPGQWFADLIEPASKDRTKLSFTGVIETMPGVPGIWMISGNAVQVNSETDLDAGLKVGTPVRVNFVMLPNNGGMLAKEIEALEENRPTPVPTATKTVTVTGTPGTATPTTTLTVTGTPGTATPTTTVVPKNDTARCDNRTQQQPEAVRLAFRYSVTYEEIMGWFCKGFGFGEIDLAYDLAQASGKPVSGIFAMRSAGQGWGLIKKNVSAQITLTPDASKSNNGKKPVRTPGPNNGNKP